MSLADELSDDYDSDLDRRDPMRNIRTEIHARDLASELLSALPGQHYSVLGDTVRLFFNDRGDNEDQRPVTLDILADASPGCGGVVWPAGTVLSSYLVKRPTSSLKGKMVVEIGSGTGLAGIVASMLGGSVWVTDQAPLLDIMRTNVALNKVQASCQVAELNWGEPIPTHVPGHPDVILAADCVYYEPAFPLLVQTLHELAGPSTEILFCFKKRRKADKRFFSLLRKRFTWKQVTDDPSFPIYSREAISLLRLQRL